MYIWPRMGLPCSLLYLKVNYLLSICSFSLSAWIVFFFLLSMAWTVCLSSLAFPTTYFSVLDTISVIYLLNGLLQLEGIQLLKCSPIFILNFCRWILYHFLMSLNVMGSEYNVYSSLLNPAHASSIPLRLWDLQQWETIYDCLSCYLIILPFSQQTSSLFPPA